MLLDETQYIAPPVTLEPWRQILVDAADWLTEHEWCQGAYEDKTGARCALGALWGDAPLRMRDAPLRMSEGLHWQAECKFRNYLGVPVSFWNDTLASSKEQVITALRDCARNG